MDPITKAFVTTLASGAATQTEPVEQAIKDAYNQLVKSSPLARMSRPSRGWGAFPRGFYACS